MTSGPFTIDFKANATEALRDINRASRRLNFARYVWPMIAGAALGLVGALSSASSSGRRRDPDNVCPRSGGGYVR